MEDDHGLAIKNAHIQTLFCIDPGFLVDRDDLTKFNEWRSQDGWREEVAESFSRFSSQGITLKGTLASAYAHTDWGGYRPTLVEPPGQRFFPLEFEYGPAASDTAGSLTGCLKSIFLSTRGSLCFVYDSTSHQGEAWQTTLNLIRDYRSMFRLSRGTIETGLDTFCQLWRTAGLPCRLTRPLAELWWPYVLTYELVDVDLGIRSESAVAAITDIKKLYDLPAKPAGMDLAALTRMSEGAALYHKNTRVSELRAEDIGYRSDELWIITGERLVRCYPERDDPGEIAFFRDISSAAIILLQQRATQDSMAIWTAGQRSEQYQRAAGSDIPGSRRAADRFTEDIRKVLAASAVITEPHHLIVGTRNTFYREVVSGMIGRLGVEDRRKAALEAVQQFAAFSEAMSNYHLQESQLGLSKAAAKLAWASVLLAVVALVAGALQIYLAIVGS